MLCPSMKLVITTAHDLYYSNGDLNECTFEIFGQMLHKCKFFSSSEIKFVHSNGKTSSIISFNTIKYQSISSYVRDGPIPNVHVLMGNAHVRNLPKDMHPLMQRKEEANHRILSMIGSSLQGMLHN